MRPHRRQPTRLPRPWDSPGKNIGVGCHALLQGFFCIQGSKLHLLLLLNWQVGPLLLVPCGKPRVGPSDQIRSDQSLSYVLLFATPWTAARQASLSITNFQSLLKLMSIESAIQSNHLPGLISFRMDWLDLLAVHGILESSPTPKFKSISSLVLSFLYSPTLTCTHDYWRNQSFDKMDHCWQSNVSSF